MPVLGLLSFSLRVPSIDEGVAFYTDAGLVADVENGVARLRCGGQERNSIILVEDRDGKRIDHITLRAEGLDEIAEKTARHGGAVVEPPPGFADSGLWVTDPNGLRYHLVEHPEDPEIEAAEPFAINAPGRIVRNRRSAVLPIARYAPVAPIKLGHVLTFSPDVPASVAFVTDVFGMGLTDHSGDVIAFTCARRNSDHHVLAFAKSDGIGLHHASFQVHDPDEVGRGGRALLARSARGDWGFGRHTVGSNYFHYIQDPWGSWFEYYSDMDYIDDYALWQPTNYAPEDSLANWGPEVPRDFIHNYEIARDWSAPARRPAA